MIYTADIARYLKAATGLEAIQTPSNKARPALPYISFQLESGGDLALEFHSRTRVGDDCENVRTRVHEMIVSINIFADNGFELFDKIRDHHLSFAGRKLLMAASLGGLRLGRVQNLDFLDGPDFTPRWFAEMTLMGTRFTSDRVEAVDIVEIEGTVGGAETNLTINLQP